jgi:multidrug efflux system outer membrane protein
MQLKFFCLLMAPGSLLLTHCLYQRPLRAERLTADAEALASKLPVEWSAGKGAGLEERWLDGFKSPVLRQLVNEALEGNPDLRVSAARVEQARQQLRVATAALAPTLDAGGGASRAQRPGDQRFPGLGQRANRFTSSLDINWEPDLWGRLADTRRASKAGLQATEQDFSAARLSLAANTVTAVLEVTLSRLQIQLAEGDVSTRKTQLELLDQRLARGLEPERAALDVSLARADLARAEASLVDWQRQLDGRKRALETLLGRYPAGRVEGMNSLPGLAGTVPAGLPVELLSRRPDVLAAESRVWEALNRESAERKALLPGIRLSGDRGFSSQELENLVSTPSTVWTIASQVTQPIFQAGRLRANIRVARARYDELLNQYAAVMLTTLQEVETALAAERFLAEQVKQLGRAIEEAGRSEQLALAQYERGFVDVLTLLDSRQRNYEAQRALLNAQNQRLINRVNLHLALGGGF